MDENRKLNWLHICLFNLLIVAVYGTLMRYKIGFEFAFFNQKNLQHAHSHFAFSGWVSLLLMVLMTRTAGLQADLSKEKIINRIFTAMLFSSYGMLVSFTIQGYGFYSIAFSTISILVTFIFSYYYYQFTKETKSDVSKKWMYAALFFNILSTAGTFYLSYMMATKSIEQHAYLASVYWYLHFQYNGWFFFACTGLFVQFLKSAGITIVAEKEIFYILVLSSVPAYGLSTLWLNLPVWIYILVVLAALAQFFAILWFLREFLRSNAIERLNMSLLGKTLLFAAGMALLIKFALQAGSTIPAVSKFAFGFRPIVIAYLHLVLLAFTSVFLVFYVYAGKYLKFNMLGNTGILIFLCGVFLNEFVLGIQGVASLTYTLIPYANEALFALSSLILVGLFMLNLGKVSR
jgi:hypothetical protein